MKKLLFTLTTLVAVNANTQIVEPSKKDSQQKVKEIVNGTIKLQEQSIHTIKIDDFEMSCDDCTVEQLVKDALATYYEALADINNPDNQAMKSNNTTSDPTKYEKHVKVKRYLVSHPNTNNISSEENCSIVLSIIVAPDGSIVGKPICVKQSSTTNNVKLINQVIEAVRTQTKFNEVEMTGNTREIITIRISAN